MTRHFNFSSPAGYDSNIVKARSLTAAGLAIGAATYGLARYSFDIIVRHTAPGRQNAIYAWINSGTGFGVALAGPLALYAGEDRRLAWMLFAVLALAITASASPSS